MDWLNLSAGGVLKPGASEPVTPATLPPRWRRPDQLSGTGRHHCANGPFSRPRLKSLPMRHPERPGALATTRVVMAVHRFLAVLAKGNGRWKDLADSSEGTLCPAALGAATGDDLIRAREASLRETPERVFRTGNPEAVLILLHPAPRHGYPSGDCRINGITRWANCHPLFLRRVADLLALGKRSSFGTFCGRFGGAYWGGRGFRCCLPADRYRGRQPIKEAI